MINPREWTGAHAATFEPVQDALQSLGYRTEQNVVYDRPTTSSNDRVSADWETAAVHTARPSESFLIQYLDGDHAKGEFVVSALRAKTAREMRAKADRISRRLTMELDCRDKWGKSVIACMREEVRFIVPRDVCAEYVETQLLASPHLYNPARTVS